MRGFDVRIGWRSTGHYDPASEWFLSAWKYSDRTIAHARFTVIGFYILIFFTTKTGSESKQVTSEFKVGSSKTMSHEELKDAEFTKAAEDSEFYCYITTGDGVKYAFTVSEAIPLSHKDGRNPLRFRKWLEEQDDPIIEKLEDLEKWENE